MKRFDIVVPNKYTKNGEEKTAWKNVGTLVKFDATNDKPEGFLLELNMFPETTFKVFEQKEKTATPTTNSPSVLPDYGSEAIDESGIPF
jgi:hypothetical protein